MSWLQCIAYEADQLIQLHDKCVTNSTMDTLVILPIRYDPYISVRNSTNSSLTTSILNRHWFKDVISVEYLDKNSVLFASFDSLFIPYHGFEKLEFHID